MFFFEEIQNTDWFFEIVPEYRQYAWKGEADHFARSEFPFLVILYQSMNTKVDFFQIHGETNKIDVDEPGLRFIF